MLKPWEYLFKTHILSRGWDYYENGAVSSLKKTETGYKATVEGSYDYEVEVEIYDNEVVDMFCDCPYAEDGNYCKHMAAVLYEIEEKSAQMTSEVRENPAETEINEYRTKFRHFSAIRELEVKEYLDRKEYDKAIEVLEESKKLDKEYAGLVSKYSEQLIQVYHKTGQQEEYKKELIYQVFSCRQDNLENVKLLKAECDEEEWCTYREQILNTNSCLGIKFRFLEFEELYDRLLKTIVESGSIYTLDQYEKVLKKKFPDIIRDTYVNYVRKHAESVCDRKAYKGLMTYLKKITKYPDGRGKADQIAKEWKVIYRRRPAMMDELKKAGF